MWTFAWRNLMTRPLRTALALVGLSIPILGVLGLVCVSGGLRHLVGDTLNQIQGVVVLRENAPTPVFSSLDAALVDELGKVPGVRAVAPEVWGLPPSVEGTSLISKAIGGVFSKPQGRMQGLFDAIVLAGQDIPRHVGLRSAVFPRNMVPPGQGGGRFLNLSDRGRPHVVISRKVARDLGTKDRPKRVGDTVTIGSGKDATTLTIVGLYDTGSMFLDTVMITDIDVARRVLHEGPDKVSSIYIEADDPAHIDRVAAAIEARVPDVDARSMDEFSANFSRLLGHLDQFLMMIVSLALVVGVVGIINTMLMSTTERFAEFGVLRTNGWSQGNVLALVTLESAYLGLLAGALGCLLTALGAALANQFVRASGLQLSVTPTLIALGLGLSVAMGTLGGLYPAWRAARLVPMEAIRLGAH